MSEKGSEDASFEAEIAEQDAFWERFPPEAFAKIAASIGLAPEPDILSQLRRSLFHPFYSFYVSSSGRSRSREEWISGLREMRVAARKLLKSLRYRLALVTIGSAEDDPLFDPNFRGNVRSIAERAEKKIGELRSKPPGKGGRPRTEFWEILPDLVREYRRFTDKKATKPRWVGGSKYAGEFYDFVVAVTDCLRMIINESEILNNLPDNASAVGDGLRKRWPFDKTKC